MAGMTQALGKKLTNARMVRGQMERILHARVPIIKFKHSATGQNILPRTFALCLLTQLSAQANAVHLTICHGVICVTCAYSLKRLPGGRSVQPMFCASSPGVVVRPAILNSGFPACSVP